MTFPSRHGQRGLVLIDGLIAIVIFSIGILGMVALQASSVKLASDAKYRTDAAMLAEQIVAQMWSTSQNPATLSANFAGASGTGGTGYTNWLNNNVIGTLPGVTVSANQPSIFVDPTTSLVTVTMYWATPNDATTVHQYATITQITP